MRDEFDDEDDHHHNGNGHRHAEGDEDEVEVSGDEDDVMEEEVARRRRRLMRKYKIQEVIKRRQIMLVQVVKEERGNKGAALTTYLSLAGRYGVLMPNTARGGGISRKITTATDRKRLKTVVQSLDVPQGMGLIVRTAGAKRTKAEIKRDYEYLLRLWENIRETTLHSIAPALIYEEEDLVKRAIRDLFDKDIDGVWVEGEEGYREARDFMRMLMPSQAKKVIAYREPTPLFVAHKVEDHLAQIYSPVVPLRSGGYLVINQTEALVAVDVNSGRATKERNIEATALKTNMEAAEEAARQLRLRDLAGLIVIDFIDMDEAKNNRAVEKKLKDCLKDDRARVQMGRISPFGLMEISRQRRRTGVLEGTTHVCPVCEGVGRVRSTESSALAALRGVEREALKGGGEVTLKVPRAVGLYILNEKRAYLSRIHQLHGLYVTIQIDDAMAHADHELERTSLGQHSSHELEQGPAVTRTYEPEDDFEDFVEEEDEEEEELLAEEEVEVSEGGHELRAREEREEGERRGGRRRRRRGRGRDDREESAAVAAVAAPAEPGAPRTEEDEEHGEDSHGRRRRRRGRRGGRRVREEGAAQDGFAWARPRVPFGEDAFVWHDPAALEGSLAIAAAPANDRAPSSAPEPEAAPAPQAAAAPSDDMWVELPAEAEGEKKPRRGRSRGRKAEAEAEPPVEAAPEPIAAPEPEPQPEPVAAEELAPAAKPKRARKAAAKPAPEPEPVVVAAAPEPAPKPASKAPRKPRESDAAEISTPPPVPKKGWWRR